MMQYRADTWTKGFWGRPTTTGSAADAVLALRSQSLDDDEPEDITVAQFDDACNSFKSTTAVKHSIMSLCM